MISLAANLLFVLGSIIFIFLYWRAGKRELIDASDLFDTLGIWLTGAFLGGRIFDFLIRLDYYQFSPVRFVFFNAYGGFNLYGAILGSVVAGYIYFRRKKISGFLFWDTVAPALCIFLAIANIANYLKSNQNIFYLYYSVGYLLIFWILKRLEVQKRQEGFFAFLFLILFSALDLLLFKFKGGHSYITKLIAYDLIFPLVILTTTSTIWYLISKRRLNVDLKAFFAFVLIVVFKIKRIVTSTGEADNLAKSIIVSPMLLVKLAGYLVKWVQGEIQLIFTGLMHNLGVRK